MGVFMAVFMSMVVGVLMVMLVVMMFVAVIVSVGVRIFVAMMRMIVQRDGVNAASRRKRLYSIQPPMATMDSPEIAPNTCVTFCGTTY